MLSYKNAAIITTIIVNVYQTEYSGTPRPKLSSSHNGLYNRK